MAMPISFLDVMDSVKYFGLKGAFHSENPSASDSTPRQKKEAMDESDVEKKQFESTPEIHNGGH